ncbi:TIGR03668 family PPOX class F420-dependent oxidoreductase [Planctomonas sp. JC2975]|uniref:TIGR03668 family PPOX class F420-dependent oxidoreductase n=1 Tax=Planctomonas sp. JC2975 TaxID=2729626 RepID=UPI001473ED06|nr:TIGR03668 family PPOX class F420-dependent oxidoreductase [Planctomonas sp. JC2975]NNC13816.1 TIGR03668 family PPOX class F420-dependent oxidoreductase [Planctomonas sp. JC2975]
MRLTEADARARLSGARVATLATVGSKGAPHVVPITFAVEGDLIYSAVDHKPKTTTRLQRLRNIAENPQVALLVHRYSDDWDMLWWVRVDGRARVISTAEEVRHPIDLLEDRYEQYRAHRPAGAVIEVRADRWTGWSSS